MNDEHLDTLAERVAERLALRLAAILPGPQAPELIDAAEAARRLGVSRDYVYEHSERLGAIRMGDGPRARLRFDPRQLDALGAVAPAQRTPPRRTTGRAPGAALLPIAGERKP